MAAGDSPLAVPAATAPTSNPDAVFEIVIAKERQKFACAHFTVFPDGTVERLHGHNYHLGVTVRGRHLAQGLLVPFQTMKAGVAALCDAWDEHVFVATQCAAVSVREAPPQVEVTVDAGPAGTRFYSFPADDVVLLPCQNVSCESLAQIAWSTLVTLWGPEVVAALDHVAVTITESAGQSVSYGAPVRKAES